MLCKLWALSKYRAVGIIELIARLAETAHDLLEKQETVRAGKALVIIGKELAYIAHGGSAEQSIHERVNKHVRIGMTEKPFFIGDIHPAEYQPSVGHKPVHIIAMSYPHIRLPCLSKSLPQASRRSAL